MMLVSCGLLSAPELMRTHKNVLFDQNKKGIARLTEIVCTKMKVKKSEKFFVGYCDLPFLPTHLRINEKLEQHILLFLLCHGQKGGIVFA